MKELLEGRRDLLEKAIFQNARQMTALENQLASARNEGIALAGALIEIEHLLEPDTPHKSAE